jgi:hypothetical protein
MRGRSGRAWGGDARPIRPSMERRLADARTIRARMGPRRALLIKRDERVEPFDSLAEIEETPPRWNSPHVGRRIAGGFGDKGGAASAWPAPVLARCALVHIYAQSLRL